jgi:hypothetical protein
MSIRQLARAQSHGIGATAVWHRDIFDLFGPITETGIYEDSVLLFRARLIGEVSYIDDRLVRYRRGVGLTAGKADGEKEFETSLAVLRQRLADCRSGAPHERKVIRNLERKLGIRAERHATQSGETDGDE